MERFKTLKFERKTTIVSEGIEISCFIAGVNSGAYQLPFVIAVRTWAKKWWFKKFFYREMELNIHQIKELKTELDKVITYYENKN